MGQALSGSPFAEPDGFVERAPAPAKKDQSMHDPDHITPLCRLAADDTGIVLRHGDEEFSDRLDARDVWVFESEG